MRRLSSLCHDRHYHPHFSQGGRGWQILVSKTSRLRKNVQFLAVIMLVLLKNFKFTIDSKSLYHVATKIIWNQGNFHWKLSESRLTFAESPPKANWLSLKALQKQTDFHLKLSESRLTFTESPPKADWLLLNALQKLPESRLTLFVESPLKASWLLLKALRKDDFHWKLYKSA